MTSIRTRAVLAFNQLAFTYWRFGRPPSLRKAVRISVRKELLDRASVHDQYQFRCINPVITAGGPSLLAREGPCLDELTY